MDGTRDRYTPTPPPGGPPPRKSKGIRGTRPGIGIPPPPPPGSPPSKKKGKSTISRRSRAGQSIVEERRRAAMAMYESTEMVDDESQSFLAKSPIIPIASASTTSSQDTPNENRAPPRTSSSSMKLPTIPLITLKSAKNPSPSRRRSNSLPKITLGSSPSSSDKSDGKKGFFRKMISRKGSPSRNNKTPSPMRINRDSPNHAISSKESPRRTANPNPTTPRSPSPALRGKTRRAKKKGEETSVGMPLGAKPGTSYKSTPHSADIVPRKQPASGEDSIELTVETAMDDGQLEMAESFSPFRLDRPEYDDLPNNAQEYRGDRVFPDDISNLTDPSFHESSTAKCPPSSNRMERIGEEDSHVDQFGNHWEGHGLKNNSNILQLKEKGSDPFSDPFFVEENQPVRQRKEPRRDPSPRNSLNPEQVADRLFGVQVAEADELVSEEEEFLPQESEFWSDEDDSLLGDADFMSEEGEFTPQEDEVVPREEDLMPKEEEFIPSLPSPPLPPPHKASIQLREEDEIMPSRRTITAEVREEEELMPTSQKLIVHVREEHTPVQSSQQRLTDPAREEHDVTPSRPKADALVIEESESITSRKREGPPSPESKQFLTTQMIEKRRKHAREKRKRDISNENKLTLHRAEEAQSQSSRAKAKQVAQEALASKAQAKLVEPCHKSQQFYQNQPSQSGAEEVTWKANTSREQANLVEQSLESSGQAKQAKKENNAASNPATKKALDLLQKQDARLGRARTSSATTTATPEHASVPTERQFPIPRRKHMRLSREINPPPGDKVLLPARAPTLACLSRIAKQGRKPLLGKKEPPRSKYIVPKSVMQRPTSTSPERGFPQERCCYVKKRRTLLEPHVVAIGVATIRSERQSLIDRGVVKPIQRRRKEKTASAPTGTVDESKMDPIQRAGYRLLSKAAVPIQTEIRRFLAQREAVDRMWALIEIQSYLRRWRCEAYLYAHTWAAVKIQANFRGWQVRDKLDERVFAALSIQRVARGYLAAIQVYDTLYSLITIQSVVRGYFARRRAGHKLGTAIIVQSFCRMCLAQLKVEGLHDAATAIQSVYRGYSAQLHFQFDIVDIIIVQSIVRRWKARKITACVKGDQMLEAATTIQKNWRMFQAYSDYVFSIADILVAQRSVRLWRARREAQWRRNILVAQRTVRVWCARREAQWKRRDRSATKIQAQWRMYTAQMTALYKLVHIIIVQSVLRRRLALNRVRRMRIQLWAAKTIQSWWRVRCWIKELRCQMAATKIQANWRRFWEYSHYLILGYEIVRIQALYRGHRARRQSNLQMGCAIIIQSSMRRFLAFERFQEFKIIRVLVAAGSECLRNNNAAKHIQRKWRFFVVTRKQIHAANVIQRFFKMVRILVDMEIHRQNVQEKKKKKDKVEKAAKKKRRGKPEEAEENMLERAWLNTMEHDPYGKKGKGYQSSQSRSLPEKTPPEAVDVRPFDEMSEVTVPTVFNRSAVPARANTLTRKELSEDLSLEEAWIDTEVRQVKQRLQAEHEYLQRHGLQHHGSYQQQPRSGRQYAAPRTTPRRGTGQGDMHCGSPMRQHSPMRQQQAPVVSQQPPVRRGSPRRSDVPYVQGPSRGQGRQYYEANPRGHPSPGQGSPGYQGDAAAPAYYEKPRYPDSQSQIGHYQGGEMPRGGRHGGYGSPRYEGPAQRPTAGYHGDYNSAPDRNGYYRN